MIPPFTFTSLRNTDSWLSMPDHVLLAKELHAFNHQIRAGYGWHDVRTADAASRIQIRANNCTVLCLVGTLSIKSSRIGEHGFLALKIVKCYKKQFQNLR